MSYRYVKAVCLFCDATVFGDERHMLRGHNLYGRRGAIPKQLREKPEHRWVWNGLGNAVFYLCPQHNGNEDYDKAFKWAKQHGEKEG